MRRRRLLIDIDGVLANFVRAYLDIVHERLGYMTAESDINKWDVGDALRLVPPERALVHQDLLAPGFAAHMPEYPDACASVEGLMADGFDVWFVTSPLHESHTWVFDRQRWIERRFGVDMCKKTISVHHKHAIEGDVFVDDKNSNVWDWALEHPNGVGVVYQQPWNTVPRPVSTRNIVRTNDWERIQALLHGGLR